MTVDAIISYAQENPGEFIAIITLLVSILSQFLSMIEYFRLKGKWDFYYLDDTARHFRNHGFNPEYLATSLFIFTTLFILFTNEPIREFSVHIWYSIGIIFIISCGVLGIGYLVFYTFSEHLLEMGAYDKKELRMEKFEQASFTAIKYFALIVVLFSAYSFLVSQANYLKFVLLIIVAGTLLVFSEYCIAKIGASRNRLYDIATVKVQDSTENYCIVGKTDTEKYYVVKMKEENGTLYLYLDQRMLIDIKDQEVHRQVFKKLVRIHTGRVIPYKRYPLS